MSAILTIDRLSVRLPAGADRALCARRASRFSVAANEIVCVVGRIRVRQVDDRQRDHAVATWWGGRSRAAKSCSRIKNLAEIDEAEMRRVRGAGIAMIFQEPMTALSPLRSIGDQIGEMFSIHTI